MEPLFEKSTAAWVKDRTWHPSQRLTLQKDGTLRMAMTVADTRELLGWVLSFGSGVQVRKPESLRAAVQEEARRLLQSIASDPREDLTIKRTGHKEGQG